MTKLVPLAQLPNSRWFGPHATATSEHARTNIPSNVSDARALVLVRGGLSLSIAN